jgi:hypothetical protein
MPPNTQVNPFQVKSPEKLSAPDAVSLFVDVFTDFNKVHDQGHSFLNGPRGSGKSMMFRYLQPDCQCLAGNVKLHELTFLSIYVPVKNTSLNIAELERIEKTQGEFYINEHLMTLFFAVEAVKSVRSVLGLADPDKLQDPSNRELLIGGYRRLLSFVGVSIDPTAFPSGPPAVWLEALEVEIQRLYGSALQYVRQLSFRQRVDPPQGPLLGYMDFLFPLLEYIRRLTFAPPGPIYLLVDDADNLSLAQTMVLNTWVSSRTSAAVSIKISTQMEYKSFHTISGRTIDSTHDFAEVNICDIYTSYKGKYLRRVREIVEKRLNMYSVRNAEGNIPSPDELFPVYGPQEEQIEGIRNDLKARYPIEGRGFRASDDVVRYARPMYMAKLAGTRKSSSKYMYAGFEQLVHISSGVVRHFLGPAANMFSEVQATNPQAPVLCIPPSVQDEVIRADSYAFRFAELEKMRDDAATKGDRLEAISKLSNLIEVLGGVFRRCLLAERRSERRVFSIALYDEPDDDLRNVLMLGVRYGYFHLSSIGKKDGTGRTRLYVLNRRLAPTFNLDPNGFVGYLWFSPAALTEGMAHPNTLLARMGRSGAKALPEVGQLSLFEERDSNADGTS